MSVLTDFIFCKPMTSIKINQRFFEQLPEQQTSGALPSSTRTHFERSFHEPV
jgi:hypothetical protein